MTKMTIGISDDEKSVLEAYNSAIKKLGHSCVAKDSIRRTMDYLKDSGQPLDILFLDHHFRGEESGVSMIAEMMALRPDLDIVVTTKQPLEPNFVQDIVNAGVGFFKKSVIDPVWLEMEISQRVNIRNAKLAMIQRRVAEFAEHISESKEGWYRFPFFGREKKLTAVQIDSIENFDRQFIYPQFERFETIHAGETKDITKEVMWEESVDIKASTTQEVGLKVSDSAKFLGSKLGAEIIGKLKKEHSIAKKTKLQSSLKIGQRLQILESEYNNGVRRKEFFRGILHLVFKVVIKIDCIKCGSSGKIDIFILVPQEAVEVAVAYDKKGMIYADEDARKGYQLWTKSV